MLTQGGVHHYKHSQLTSSITRILTSALAFRIFSWSPLQLDMPSHLATSVDFMRRQAQAIQALCLM